MTDTLCYFTTFVCHYNQLPLVAKRYQERLTQIAALPVTLLSWPPRRCVTLAASR